MPPTRLRYLPRLHETVALLVAWCCVVVVGGHGFGVLGVFLLLGLVETTPALMAWGVFALLLVTRRTGPRALYGAGLACLLAACVAALQASEWKELTAATALPFLALAAVQGRRLVKGAENEPSVRWLRVPKGGARVRWPRGTR